MSGINHNIAAAGQRAMSELTFGAELEFVAIVPKKIIMQHGSAQQYLISYLRSAQVMLPCDQPGCKEKEHAFALPMHRDEDYTGYDWWKLDVDLTVGIEQETFIKSDLVGYRFEGLELISRVQKYEGTSLCPTGQVYPCNQKPFEWSWRTEFKAFLDSVHKAFSGPGFCAIVNDSAGFHVHLGHGDKGLPLEIAQGLMGSMVALERSFDQLLPTNRISGSSRISIPGMWVPNRFNPLPGIQIEGFHALYKPGVMGRSDFSSSWCPAISNVMFSTVQDQIYHTATQTDPRKAPTTSPTSATAAAESATISAETAKEIEQHLSSFNVPGWLNMIKSHSSIDELKDMFTHDKYTALSLRGLGETGDRTKPTAEVRIHAGSLDFEEISAWLDLLTSLAHWAETTSRGKIFSYLEESWRDVDYNICSFAKAVGASDATVAHYGNVLSSSDVLSYAQWRFERYTSSHLTYTDKLENFNSIIEEQRRKVFSRENVDEKIRWKLESGRYGQLPTAFLESQPEPEIFSRPEAKFLHLGGESQKAWAEFLNNYYLTEYKLDLTVKDSAGAADDDDDDDDDDSDSSSSEGSDESDDTSETVIYRESEDEFDDGGFYGIHPALAAAYNLIPGQHLTHLEQTVVSMPALPSPTTPNMEAFDELKDDTCARIHDALLNSALIDGLTAANTKDEVENIIARAVEGTKQLHVLNACVTEKASAERYMKKRGKKE
ncbi:hypothetical protein E4T44_05937 [Aureobasidium sp. EXF-8845]|nr:hypothetical protein E4T44_05937 [Aureobasidium sp. EXF-8845]KAI4849500.1 hypothetical protein E4T45_05889 [Aureobasidium sp. EXF-8846]